MKQILTTLEQYNISGAAVLTTLAVIVLAAIVVLLANRVLRGWFRPLATRLNLPSTVGISIARVVSAVVWTVALIVVLAVWGVSVGGLWTLLVSAAAVVGVGFLATWAMISNVTAGLFITIWRPFYLGDRVEILPEAVKGRVVDRNMMFVVLREDGGAAVQIPNNLFFQKIFRVTGSYRSAYEALDRGTELSD